MYTKNIEIGSFINKIGEENNLSFSRCEVMKRLALGLDEEQRKLSIVQKTPDGLYDWRIINLDNINTHFVKKTYASINAHDLKRGILEEYLETVTLYIELSNSKQPIEIVFYNHNDHNIFELSELEQIAKEWEIIISRSLIYRIKYRNTLQNYKSQYWQGF